MRNATPAAEVSQRAARLRSLRRQRRWLLYELEIRYCRRFCPEALAGACGTPNGGKEDGSSESV